MVADMKKLAATDSQPALFLSLKRYRREFSRVSDLCSNDEGGGQRRKE
jgi:hypothetical protein